MTMDQQSAEGDLAFMRALIDESDMHDRSLGINYFAAGLLYGIQSLAHSVLILWEIEAPSWVGWTIGLLPTVLFLSVNIHSIWQNRERPFGTGTAKRALGAAFAGIGIATLVLAGIFGVVAFQRNDWTIWLLFPIVVCACQGAIWFTASMIRRKVWYGVAAFGWLMSTLVLSAFLDQPGAYASALGSILILLMAVPGYSMLRSMTLKP